MTDSRIIVGIGEALVDILPASRHIGGAPLNVAVHAQQLGNRGTLVSRVGQDANGRLILDELNKLAMDTSHIQSDPDNPTGTVYVDFDEDGQPAYEITDRVAWDYLQWDGDLDELAGQVHAVCFGTLAQREAQTRNTVLRFVDAAHRAVRLLDINLRKPHDDRRMIERSLTSANALKLNRDELAQLTTMFHLPEGVDDAVGALMKKYPLNWVALTQGRDGTVVFTPKGKHQSDGPAATTSGGSTSRGGDAVGAGDAVSAALLHGVLRRWPWDRTLKLANAMGAHVVGQAGACPPLTDTIQALAKSE